MSYFKDLTIDVSIALKNIVNLLNRPIWVNPVTGSVRLDTVAAVTTVTTCSSVTNAAALGGLAPNEMLYQTPMRSCWALSVRSRIS